jgi:hypothetical protein
MAVFIFNGFLHVLQGVYMPELDAVYETVYVPVRVRDVSSGPTFPSIHCTDIT